MWENIDISILQQQKKEKCMMLEPDYHIIKFFRENILAIEMRKSQIKILMYEFCYGYVKPKYSEKAKLCYMDTYNLIVYIKQIKFVKTL